MIKILIQLNNKELKSPFSVHLETTVGVATYTADIFSYSYLHEVCNIVTGSTGVQLERENKHVLPLFCFRSFRCERHYFEMQQPLTNATVVSKVA